MVDTIKFSGKASVTPTAADQWSQPLHIRGHFQLSIADALIGTWRLRRSFDYVPPVTDSAANIATAIAAATWGTVKDYIDSTGVEASDVDEKGAYYSVGCFAFTSRTGTPAATLRF